MTLKERIEDLKQITKSSPEVRFIHEKLDALYEATIRKETDDRKNRL